MIFLALCSACRETEEKRVSRFSTRRTKEGKLQDWKYKINFIMRVQDLFCEEIEFKSSFIIILVYLHTYGFQHSPECRSTPAYSCTSGI